MTQDDDGSAPMLGSQPVAWAVQFDGDAEPFCLSFDKGKAIDEAGGVGKVFPLYRQPQPTLTDEEREAIEWAIGRELDAEWYGGPEPDTVAAFRGLLRRLG